MRLGQLHSYFLYFVSLFQKKEKCDMMNKSHGQDRKERTDTGGQKARKSS